MKASVFVFFFNSLLFLEPNLLSLCSLDHHLMSLGKQTINHRQIIDISDIALQGICSDLCYWMVVYDTFKISVME